MRQVEADKAFLTQGITFTVYGDEQGTEWIFPFDLLPRIFHQADDDVLSPEGATHAWAEAWLPDVNWVQCR